MKKYLSVILVMIILSTVHAYVQKNAELVQSSSTGVNGNVKLIEESGIILGEGINAFTKAGGNLLTEEEMSVYEAYLAANTDEGYLYTYLDYDNDGRQELYYCYNADSGTYGYVMKYAAGGLKRIDSGKLSEENIKGIEWKEVENYYSADTASVGEWTHEGVYAYIDQLPYTENDIWYPDEQAFLSQYGFAESTPFYKYVLPNGSIRLVLYYDEQTGLGCGLRYYQRDPSDIITSGVYGFSFMGAEDGAASWTDRLSVDYTKFESCWGDGDTGSYYESYKENIEYDDAGRVAHYDSSGIIEEGEEPEFLLWMDYKYDDNGTLRQRQYYHNQRAFSTSYQAWSSYFDELGRLEHEDLYITHGSIDYYYIYLDEGAKPAYGLCLDNNLGWWIPEFVKF